MVTLTEAAMIAKIIQWSLKQPLLVLLSAAALLGWGSIEALRMPVDVFPDLTAPRVTVVVEAHGMAPEEVEVLITFPLETAFNSAMGVRRVRSSSGVGFAVITVEFDWGMDIYRARQIVAEKLQLVRGALPPDIPPPVMQPVTSIMGEIMFIALTSERHSAMELKTQADWVVRRRLLAVPGVAQVIPIGGDTKQYQVILKPERLVAYDIAMDEVVAALRETNQNISAGFYVEGGQEYLIHGIGRVQRLEDIRETLIGQRGGQSVLVRHVAEVALGPAPKRGTGALNGEAAVIIGIQKQPGTNTLALTARLDQVLAELQASLPSGMIFNTHIFRQADFITVSINNLLAALRDGAILVAAIVFAFLMSTRASVITLLAVPLSLVTVILVMKALGTTFNTMTLGGMTIALGALVDDAIIVMENIVRRLRENQQRDKGQRRSTGKVVFEATREIQGSIVFATLIIVLVFLPLVFLSGVEGRLMQPLGVAYVVSLAASLLVAITVTPVLSALLLPQARIVQASREISLARSLKRHYERLLAATITQWKVITLIAMTALAAALITLAGVGQVLLPSFNEGSLTINTVTLPGTSLEQSDRLGQRVEKILLSYPEVVSTARRTGRAELDPNAQAIYASEIDVNLRQGERSKEAFLAALRADLARLPGMQINIGQPISHRIDHMLSGTRANIAVKIFGPDLYELRRLGQQVKAVMAGVPGVVDLAVQQQTDIPFLTIRFKRQAIARHGLRVQEVAEAVKGAFYGQPVSKILEGRANFDLVVRYDPRVKADLEAVRATLMTTGSGAHLPLHALAEIRKDRSPNFISREDVQRKMVVMANVAGRDLVSAVEEIQQGVRQSLSLPAGYHVEYGGQFKSAKAAFRTLSIVSVLVILGIFLLLFMAFNSARDAFLVMLNLPLALIGGVVGVYFSGGILSVASIIGFITLFGIATRNGVMMIAHIHHLVERERVRDPMTAVIRGAKERLIPILMTALATALALIPLALGAGEPGSEIQAPMAMVILFGLLTSTALNMMVVPALYLRFGVASQKLRHP
ncbi:multidrug transporter AcrB [Nitrosococcus oceani]|nr:multidrug transporter AcrB [Nitrosococcus oceani]